MITVTEPSPDTKDYDLAQSCTVTHAISPGHFYVRLEDADREYQKLQKDMARKFRPFSDDVKLKQGSFVVVQHHGQVLRAKTLSQICEGCVNVRFIDTGKITTMPMWKVGYMSRRFRDIKPYCQPAMLSNVVPAGSSKGFWTLRASERFEAILESGANTGRPKILITKEQDKRLKVRLFLTCYAAKPRPFEPHTIEIVDVGKRLNQEGLAIKIRPVA